MAVPVKRARRILDRFKEMETDKATWNNLFQLVAEYVMTRKMNFTEKQTPGVLQTDHLYDDTAASANHLMAAAIIGATWPNGAKSFRIGMPSGMEEEIGEETEEIKQYYEFVTQTMVEHMDNPRAGFMTSLEEYALDQGAFGISGIMVDDNEDVNVPLIYRAVDAKKLYVGEGKNGFINTIFIKREFSVRQLVDEYGFENVAARRQKEFKDGDVKTRVMVLQAIEPRMEHDPAKFGVKNMPISSIHIDIAMEKIMLESGMLEIPGAVTRFYKAMGEVYGRSPAMNALPSILEANALGEAWILAVEKTLDPSLLVLDDGAMGNGAIDTSPGGITVVSVSGRIGASSVPIQPLFLVGDLQWTALRRTEIAEIIKNHFFQDRLLDLNNEQRMTLGEANIRNELRGQTLNTIYSRQYAELFVPIIDVTFNKLRRRGLLGVIPGSQEEAELLSEGVTPRIIPEAVVRRMLNGQDVYKIQFISPAIRIMQAEELTGIEHLIQTTVAVAPVQPGVLDIVDWDWTYRRIQELDGAPRKAILSAERLAKLRKQRQEQQQAQAELEAQREQSETARNMGQAISSVAGQGAAN